MAVRKPLKQAVRRVAAKAVKRPVVKKKPVVKPKTTVGGIVKQKPKLSTIRSYDQLSGVAGSQVEEEIRGETLPLEMGIAGTERDRTRDLGDLNAAYGAIMPFVSESAQRYGQYSQAALEAQKGIYREAGGKLDQLRQQQASEAQQLAQQMGGPVPLEDFTGPVAEAQADFTSAQGGGLLHALAGSQANLAQVEGFAGQVFPMVRMEETGKTIRHFEDRLADLNQQIESIKGSGAKRKTTRLNELVGQEREYELGKGQLTLEKLKADRDWTIARRQQALDSTNKDLEWANLMGYRETKVKVGKPGHKRWKTIKTPTLAGRQLGETIRQNQATEGLTAAQLNASIASTQADAADAAATRDQAADFNKQKGQERLRERAAEYIDAIEQGGGVIETTKQFPVAEGEDGNYELDDLLQVGKWPSGEPRYVVLRKVKEEVGGNISGPRNVYFFLTGRGIPKAMAQKVIRDRYNIPKWTPTYHAEAEAKAKAAAKKRRQREQIQRQRTHTRGPMR